MNLEQTRKQKGITQVELARAVGVSVNTIQAWERNVSTPSPENQKKLDDALEVLPFTDPLPEVK